MGPIKKRLYRDVKKDGKKYFVLFILMSFMIGIASGVFVANDSMMKTIDNSYQEYSIENGHLEFKEKPTDVLLEAIEKEVDLTSQFYKDGTETLEGNKDYKGSVRVFPVRKEVNLACVMEGRLPKSKDEIAIDRAHASNNAIQIGDVIHVGNQKYKVVGTLASSDYSCLFKNNADLMFDALKFNIAFTTQEGWDTINANPKYQYAYTWDKSPKDESQEKKWADRLLGKIAVLCASGGLTSNEEKIKEYSQSIEGMMELSQHSQDQNELIDFVPRYANQSIQFARNDMGKDQAMMNVLVYIFIAVLAFVFAMTTSNKIREEASIIGTLKAMGYTKAELIRFYMCIPMLVTLISALVGNILGYTVFKDVAVGLYYNSYSLLKYETLLNPKAFIITTLIPVLLMGVINFVVIARLLKLSPMRFLRRDLSRSKSKKAMRLPSLSFFNRFRLRILFQNIFDYLTLFCGIVFIMVLLGFSIGLPESLDHYKESVPNHLFAQYQTILKENKDTQGNIITTSIEAEPFSTTNLLTIDGVRENESITVYGIKEKSQFIQIKETLKENEVVISSAYQDKFGYEVGDSITLKEKYSNTKHTFKIKGVYDYPATLAIFMPNDFYNKTFDLEVGHFDGYLSNEKITDIDSDQIYATITKDEIMALSRQLDHSMGSFADYIAGVCLLMGVLVMYLLTKTIIEKNATSISMVKVLGYENKEINRLYIRLTTLVTIVLAVVSALLGIALLGYLFRLVMYGMEGWFSLYISVTGILKMIGIVLAAYGIVAYLDMRQIKKIPLSEALKNVE